MHIVNRLVFVFLVACGGTVSSGDDADVTPEVAGDAATRVPSTSEVTACALPLGSACDPSTSATTCGPSVACVCNVATTPPTVADCGDR